MDDLWITVLASVVTGAVSSLGTIKALQVHIFYLRENIERMQQELDSHALRITGLEIRTTRK